MFFKVFGILKPFFQKGFEWGAGATPLLDKQQFVSISLRIFFRNASEKLEKSLRLWYNGDEDETSGKDLRRNERIPYEKKTSSCNLFDSGYGGGVVLDRLQGFVIRGHG